MKSTEIMTVILTFTIFLIWFTIYYALLDGQLDLSPVVPPQTRTLGVYLAIVATLAPSNDGQGAELATNNHSGMKRTSQRNGTPGA